MGNKVFIFFPIFWTFFSRQKCPQSLGPLPAAIQPLRVNTDPPPPAAPAAHPRGTPGAAGHPRWGANTPREAKNSPARSHSIGLVGDLSHCNTALMTSIRHYHNPPTRIIRIFGYCTASKLGPPLTTVRGAPRRYKQ